MKTETQTYMTISRKWANPKIVVTVSTEGIDLKMNMADFRDALLSELELTLSFMNSPGTVLEKLDAALDVVLEGVKEESAKIVNLP